jgi:hypothetical protein
MAEILMITAIAGAENCASVLSKQFQMAVDVAASRKEALAALRRGEYQLVIADESMIEPGDEPEHGGSDALFAHTGLAMLIEVNFAIAGTDRLVRLVRASLARRRHERELALQATSSAIFAGQRETVAGLLLQAQLALNEPEVSPGLAARLGTIVELAASLSRQCGAPLHSPANLPHAPSVPRPAALPPALSSPSAPAAALIDPPAHPQLRPQTQPQIRPAPARSATPVPGRPPTSGATVQPNLPVYRAERPRRNAALPLA